MQKLTAPSVYIILSALMTLANTAMFVTLSVYYVTTVGMTPLQLVLVGTAVEVTILLFEVPTGVVADTYSRRLSVILGMFVLSAAWFIEGSLPLFAAIIGAEMVRGIGETFLSGALDAWLADEVGEDDVGRVYLRSGQISRLVSFVGIGVSVGLASLALNWPVLFGGAMYLLTGVFLALAMPETGFQPTPRPERGRWRAMGTTFHDGLRVVRGRPILVSVLLASVVYGAASEGFDRLWEAHLLTNFSFPALGNFQPVVWFGIIAALGNLVSLVVTEVFRRRLEGVSRLRVPTARVLLVLNGLTIASTLVFGLAGGFGLALVAVLAKGAVGALSGPLYNSWLIQNIDARVRATVLSMSSLTNAFGQSVCGPGVGWLGNRSGLRAAIVASGLLLTPLFGLYAQAMRARVDRDPAPTVSAVPLGEG